MEVATRKFTDRRQLDIPLTSQYHFIIPTDVDGRLTTEDFIFFNLCCDIALNDYDVVIESFNGTFKKLGALKNIVRLPHVHFVDNSLLMVLPRNDTSKPKFVGTVRRGNQYNLLTNHLSKYGFYLLQ
jgi:hypothetical protein